MEYYMTRARIIYFKRIYFSHSSLQYLGWLEVIIALLYNLDLIV